MSVVREHGPELAARNGPGYDGYLPHDAVHFLVEADGRLIGMITLACLVPPALFVPPLIAAIATGTVLTGIIITDNRIEQRQHPPVSPPGPHRSTEK